MLALVWLMVLVTIGTLAQADMPLVAAMELYFRRPVVWLGGAVPVPGVPPVLAFISFGLLVQLGRTKLRRSTVGAWLAHMGVLLLIVAGLAATLLMQPGYVAAPEGHPTRLWQGEGATESTPPNEWPVIGLLPFEITVTTFNHRFHPGTNIPAHFSSNVTITPDGGVPWQATISMNEPLRYMGYTMYQSSYLLAEGAPPVSILAVVHDRTRLLPYIATGVLALGVLLQLLARRRVAAVLLLPLLMAGQAMAVDSQALGQLPVQHQGRVKPLAAVAETAVPFVLGRKIGNDAAMDVLAAWLVTPESIGRTPMVLPASKIPPMVVLRLNPNGIYAPAEIVAALLPHQAMVEALRLAAPSQLSKSQTDLLALTDRVETLLSVARTFSLLQPVEAPTGAMARALGTSRTLTLGDVWERRAALAGPAQRGDAQALAYAAQLREMRPEQPNGLLRIIPPGVEDGAWLSPWLAWQQKDELTRNQRAALNAWATLMANPDDAVALSVLNGASAEAFSPLKLRLEMLWLHYPPISLAVVPLLVALGLAFWRPRFALPAALAGWALLGFGMLVRMVILERPPVATLYESVLFVAWGALGLAMVFRKSSQAILPAGVLVALVLAVVSHGLTQGQDTMGMLTAVLDTNFWLATHVLTITGGYAASLLVGALGLWVMLQRARLASRESRRRAIRVMGHMALWAMLLTATGTLLGGIWASQSWGRFWGWDPKENGALILTLWLVMVMHLRFLKPCPTRWMLTAAACTPVVVALSWFGVNLLGVGLHSYGFATGLANGLALFCAGYGSVVIGLVVFDRVKAHED